MRHLQSKPLGLETKMEPATLCRLLFSVEEATVASLMAALRIHKMTLTRVLK